MAHKRKFALPYAFATLAVLFFILLGGVGATARAQNIPSINGTVYDTSKAAVPHATLVLTNLDTKVDQTVQGNSAGDFVFLSLLPGKYVLHASAPSFQSWNRKASGCW